MIVRERDNSLRFWGHIFPYCDSARSGVLVTGVIVGVNDNLLYFKDLPLRQTVREFVLRKWGGPKDEKEIGGGGVMG